MSLGPLEPFSDGIQLLEAVIGVTILGFAGYKWFQRKLRLKKKVAMVVYVSTGGTCRDPMAMALTQHLLLGRFPHITVKAAGTSGDGDKPPTPAARQVIRDRLGIDYLKEHRSARLDQDLVDEATIILAMSSANKVTIIRNFANADNKTYTLKEYFGESGDVLDPWKPNDGFGLRAIERYNRTFDELSRLISKKENLDTLSSLAA